MADRSFQESSIPRILHCVRLNPVNIRSVSLQGFHANILAAAKDDGIE